MLKHLLTPTDGSAAWSSAARPPRSWRARACPCWSCA